MSAHDRASESGGNRDRDCGCHTAQKKPVPPQLPESCLTQQVVPACCAHRDHGGHGHAHAHGSARGRGCARGCAHGHGRDRGHDRVHDGGCGREGDKPAPKRRIARPRTRRRSSFGFALLEERAQCEKLTTIRGGGGRKV